MNSPMSLKANISQILMILFLFCGLQVGKAQVVSSDLSEFVSISWPSSISKDVPSQQMSVPLGKNYSIPYAVSIEYPEYVEINYVQKKASKKLGFEPTDSIIVHSQVGISRKQGILDISYVPIIRQGNKWLRLKSCKVAIKSQSATSSKKYSLNSETASVSRYAAHSVLSSGKWAKIRVAKEGVYALTKSFLSSLGFGDMSKVKVYGYGGRRENDKISYGDVDGDYDDLEEV